MATNDFHKKILVYANWEGLTDPTLVGNLYSSLSKGKELFSFEYDESWLKSGFSQMIDPDLQFYSGPQYLRDEKTNFGIFLDSCPDRWGRVLMQRREAITAKKENRKPITLLESDYLLGVFDGNRMGALRFKIDNKGPFLNDNKEMASPPWVSLRELEYASLKFEEDDRDDPEYSKWINMLIDPGTSLGGARPKASIVDPKNNLWIAKFPSKNDDKDIGGWEIVVNELAKQAGVNIAEGQAQRFNGKYHSFLTKRFDRTEKGGRIHFASAMTLTGNTDGTDHHEGASYLQLAEFLIRNGADANNDLIELWRRIVFNICVKNTDDHLRNHGFLLTEKGWILSPAYDINANEFGKGLSLNISDTDNSLDLELALSCAAYYRLEKDRALKIIDRVKKSVSNWQELAKKYKISKGEQDRMSTAFII